MIELAKTKALDVLKQNDLAVRMAARRSQGQLQDRMLSKLPSWKELVNANTDDLVVHVNSSYREELKRFKKLVTDEKLDDLVARYPLRESRVFDKIAEAQVVLSENGPCSGAKRRESCVQAQTTYQRSFQGGQSSGSRESAHELTGLVTTPLLVGGRLSETDRACLRRMGE